MEEIGVHWSWNLWDDTEDTEFVEEINSKDWGGIREGRVDIGKGKAVYWIEKYTC